MLCILCLTASDHVIQIFDEQGLNLNVSSIIIKHFWIQPNQDDADAKVICNCCWNVLHSFHKFYEKIEAAHVNLLSTVPASDEKLKEEDESDFDNFDDCADFLAADVKLEVKEDSVITLPQVDPIPDVKQKIDSLDVLTNTTKSADEPSDSDSEIPLATLVKRNKSSKIKETTLVINNTEQRLNPSSSCDDNSFHGTNKNPSSDDSDYKATKSKARTKRVRRTKERKKPQRKAKSEGEETRVKRKIIDPVKKRELSREFDEVIQKNMKLSCSICHAPLANFFLLRKHYHSMHNERGYATCCGRKFRKRGVLVDHIYLHLNPEYFKCDKCDRIMADRRSLEVHMNTHDTSKQRIYQCDECSKSFYRKLLLERHMYTHIPDRKFNCEECQKLFSSEYTLRQHINNVHNSAYMKICEQCGKSIRGLEAFRRHQLEHAGVPIPLVQCEKCGVKLTNKYGLKRHMDSMHPETKVLHKCNVCGKIAPSAAALQRHTSYMHKCERNHKCPMCNKAFKKPGGLKYTKQRKQHLKQYPRSSIKMLCILCLEPSNHVIHIFEDEGLSLNICAIIMQHFSLQPSSENARDKVICGSCWTELDSFHKFYQKIDEAHSKLISTWSAATDSSDILSAAIRIAGIKQDMDEESENMDVVGYDDDDDDYKDYDEDDSEYDETYDDHDGELKVRRIPLKESDQVIQQYLKLSCYICQESMRNFNTLKRHFASVHHESGYVICCKLKFKSRSLLAEHIYVDHNLVYLCDKCGQVMADCKALNLHKATHTNGVSTINVTSAVTVRIEKTGTFNQYRTE